MTRMIVAASLMSIGALLLASRAYAADPSMTVVESTPGMEDLPFMAAQDVAAAQGFKIEVTTVTGGGDAGEIFLSGHTDMLLSGGDKLIGLNRQNPGQIKMIGAQLTSSGWVLASMKNGPIKDISQLKGKNVGVTGAGSTSEMFVRWGLKSAGIDPAKDVTVVALGSPLNLQAALTNNKVEAVALPVSYFLPLQRDGTINILADWAKLVYPGDNFMVRTKDLEAKRDTYVRFIGFLKQGMDKLKSDRAYAMKQAKLRLPKASDADLALALDFYEQVAWAPMDGVTTEEAYNNGAKVWTSAGRYTPADIPPYKDIVVNLAK